jgi:hypothetical protein
LPVKVEDVHLLVLHELYESAEHPVPIDATIVHARTLLHPLVPQPDGGRMYRCLTEFPSRTPGCLVPLSTLTFELDGGRLWPQVADWQAVTDAIVHLSRTRACDAIPVGLPPVAAALLGAGPTTTVTVQRPDGSRQVIGGPERQEYIDELAGTVRSFAAKGPFWPGNGLTEPPAQPAVMPYKPYHS